MYPHERSLVEKHPADKFAIVGVNSDRTIEVARDAVKKNQLSWRNFYDGGTDGPISSRWNVNGWPTIYVIDAKGTIRFKDVRGDELDSAIEMLLAEMQSSSEPEGAR
ncbi:MAG: hypothetical protein CMJ95_11745 [Planctomycetes bacterium]|nr:hypothetical protein [Planctomycetota bacterium]